MSITGVELRTYDVPTVRPEQDGTAAWESTGVLVAQVRAEGETGTGWSPCAAPTALRLAADVLVPTLIERDAFDVPGLWRAMTTALRNAGRAGVGMMAVSALDAALWDLKARLLDLPLDGLLGRARDAVDVYGSGGFVNQTGAQLDEQLTRWTDELGTSAVKIKVGQDWGHDERRDLQRAEHAKNVIGVELFVDANGGYSPGQARRMGRRFADLGVTWFEEPVSSDDVRTLALLRQVLPCDIAAGEYVDGLWSADRLCCAVDCLQLDATRCGGPTGFLRCAAVAEAHELEVSGHCAPSMHLHAGLACPNLRHLELFSDHERLEHLLFEGVALTRGGSQQSTGEPGNGLRLSPGAEAFATSAPFVSSPPG